MPGARNDLAGLTPARPRLEGYHTVRMAEYLAIDNAQPVFAATENGAT